MQYLQLPVSDHIKAAAKKTMVTIIMHRVHKYDLDKLCTLFSPWECFLEGQYFDDKIWLDMEV